MTDTTNNVSAPDPDVLSTLINRPEIRAAMTEQLDGEIKELTARLDKLQATRSSLLSSGDVESMPPARSRSAPRRGSPPSRKNQANGKAAVRGRGGRPPGAGAGHGDAILNVLKGKPSGMTAGEIWEELERRKHPGDKKTIMTYLTKFSSEKDGRLQVRGDRGSYRYSVGNSK